MGAGIVMRDKVTKNTILDMKARGEKIVALTDAVDAAWIGPAPTG